ncbi:MAG: FHIPEP family type III secretion protein [bacterium]|nr:FHIPEP family type III secretion protein [bacterium]MCP4966774.1 FHIPEP family type III secretion protein [bacterium]
MSRSSIVVPMTLVGVIMMMIIPISASFLDMMLAANITLAVLVLLGVILLSDSLDFSVFPSLLLITTLARLALNVSSTRLILLDGNAGKVIDTFGNFVIGSSVIVGLVVFLILIVIQFVVITNGATRVAEVAARFTLDAMPGKQMAIDADLGAGLIDEAQAREQRKRIATEADFYGAMDGSAKFVKGDAIASIIIVVINLFGGFAVGMGSLGMDFSEAVSTFSLLSVGDGLVSQIPALLISISTGLLVTRVGSDKDIGAEIGAQLLGNARALRFGGITIGLLAMLPGLPKIPFFVLAGLLLVAGSRRAALDDLEPEASEETPEVALNPDDPEALMGEMRVEPLELRLSYDILDLIDPSKNGDLLDRVKSLRRQIAMELGVVMPFVRTRDDVSLPPSTYSIVLRGTEVGRGTAPQDQILALPLGDGEELRALGGQETVEPVFGLKAFWIPDTARASAAATGATAVDRPSVIVTHIAEVVRANAASLLSRQDVQALVDGLRYDEPILANEVATDVLPLGLLHGVLRKLLDDRVSIRDLGPIVEVVSSRAAETHSAEQLATAARVAVGRSIVAKIAPDGRLMVMTLAPSLEAGMHESLREVDGATFIVMDPAKLDVVRVDVDHLAGEAARAQRPVTLVVGQALRGPLTKTLRGMGLDVPVLAYPELPPDIDLEPIGVIGAALANA